MLQKKAGFTIIELLMTVTLAMLLFALAAPVYTRYNNQQDFNGAAGQIVSCLQAAQKEATAPSANVLNAAQTGRYVKVILRTNGANNSLDCDARLYSEFDPNNALFSLPSVSAPGVQMNFLEPFAQATVAPYNGKIMTPGMIIIEYGVLEKGAPIYFYCNTLPSGNACSSDIYASSPQDPTGTASPIDISSGRGLAISIHVTASPSNSAIPGGHIVSGQLGAPIHYEQD